jgi:hypothetical protein
MHLFSTKTYSREIWKILEIPICGDPDFLKNFQKIRNFSDPGRAGFLSCLPDEKRANSAVNTGIREAGNDKKPIISRVN